ncbi:hypothetical protein JAAARDRAFT_131143 [Jaapia argillacea MUCL 33604]|uniref:Uncharacterized protein n=1 Tax=Jaapia argillacea MUCL 33604 TaxID=933084 RepID=A0A067PT82_9AGAM|nr:hypothetical protein JAAARDRAFT_131143 [Jaapia argillacea MUCL 33604]
MREKAVEKARRAALKESLKFKLRDKGAYASETRALVRALVNSGCSQRKVGKVLKLVGKAMGMSIDREISRRTVGRIILEGGIAAEMQIGYEVSQVKGLAFNGDGTTLRRVNQESRHLVYRAPSYSDEPSRHQCRFLGVDSAPDHSSKTQMEGWQKKFDTIAATFSESPLAKRLHLQLRLRDIVAKGVGMSGDHASDVGCTARLMRELKDKSVLEILGEEVLSLRPPQDLVLRVAEGLRRKMAEIGGEEFWNVLAIEKRTEYELAVISELTRTLGGEELAHLSPQERHLYDMFFKVGCCMHKDLNSVRYGVLAMLLWWAAHGVQGPTLLPNKDNAAVLAGRSSLPEAATDAELRALEVSTRGGVKAADLAGAIFNNKDDKKGQHDVYISWFKHRLGHALRFPDTSNTRFQTHCTAAAELILHLELYIEFLLCIRDKKDSMTWTNMEENLFRALQDIPTLTELAVLALYAETISHPYMRVVRGPGAEQVNILELGPFHTKVKTHIQKLIRHPELILSDEADYRTGSLDGQEWEHPDIVACIHSRSSGLPYLEPVFVTFLEGTLKGWERFTTEFQDDGPIAMASDADKEIAWMPATNDINEGALGWKRVISRQKPIQTAHQQNAAGMYDRNGTQLFMDAVLESDDQEYVMRKARDRDASGLERKRLTELAEAHEREVEANRMKKLEKEKKAFEKLEKLAAVTLVLDIAHLDGLNCAKLDDQLNVYCQIDEIVQTQKKKDRKTRATKLLALQGAIMRYKHLLAKSGVDTSRLVYGPNPLREDLSATVPSRKTQESWADELESEEE